MAAHQNTTLLSVELRQYESDRAHKHNPRSHQYIYTSHTLCNKLGIYADILYIHTNINKKNMHAHMYV